MSGWPCSPTGAYRTTNYFENLAPVALGYLVVLAWAVTERGKTTRRAVIDGTDYKLAG